MSNIKSAEEILDQYDSFNDEVWRFAAIEAIHAYHSQFSNEENNNNMKNFKISLLWGLYGIVGLMLEYLFIMPFALNLKCPYLCRVEYLLNIFTLIQGVKILGCIYIIFTLFSFCLRLSSIKNTSNKQ